MSAFRIDIRLGVLLVVLFGLSATALHVKAQNVEPTKDLKLTVGTMRVPPFAARSDDGTWSGLSIELWQQVAKEIKLDFEFRDFDYDPDGLLKALERREIDLELANLPVTSEGEVRFDFSHPYIAAGLGIAVRAEPNPGFAGLLTSLPWLQIIGTVAALFCALLLSGSLVWFLERRRNPTQFNPDPLRGVGDGVWWAAVTMTTTGYGDKSPVTLRGRAISIVWMFTSIFCIATFSATLASSFVVGRLKTGITGPEGLPGVRVGIVSGTAGEQWANAHGLKTTSFAFIIQASKALHRSEVDALIFERAILGHMIKEYGWTDLQILPQTLAVNDYALALSSGSALREDINRALLKITRRNEWKELVEQHLGTGAN